MSDVLDVANLRDLTAIAASRWPDRPALTVPEDGVDLTFAEVEARSNAIAHALASLGVERGDRVAMMLRNRVEFPLAWLGTVKLGAAVVPLNTYAKRRDATYQLRHSGAEVALAEPDLLALLGDVAGQVDSLQRLLRVGDGDGPEVELAALAADAPVTPPAGDLTARDTSVIQYTSGTTGPPKGCVLNHDYWLHIARRAIEYFPRLTEDDVLISAQPFYYMDPPWNLTAALATGGRLVLLDRFHPSTFLESVREHGASFFYCLGVMPYLLLQTPETPHDRDHRLRAVFCSGIPAALHERIEERWGVEWYEVFGTTETGGNILVQPEDHDELVGSGSIGRPYPDVDARVVDQHGDEVPAGEVGELIIKGPGMMDEYFRDPEATARAFRDGWFQTGDLATSDERGRFYFQGRRKDMIKRSGENVSAAEVEETLTQHPKVELAAVVPVPDDVRGEEIKAYVVLAPGISPADLPAKELADWCEDELAYFKIPRYWTYVDELPSTPSERVAKWRLTDGVEDLRVGAYDRIDGVTR